MAGFLLGTAAVAATATAPATAATTGLLGAAGALTAGQTALTLGTLAAGVTGGLTALQAQQAGELAESQAGAQIAEAELGEAERALVRVERARRASAVQRVTAAVSGRDPGAIISDINALTRRGLDIDRSRTNLATAIFGTNIATARRDARRGVVGGLLSGFSSISRLGASRRAIGGP